MIDISKFLNITQEDYDAHKGWRATTLKKIATHSISHGLLPYESSKAMDLGTYVHASVLEPHTLPEFYVLPEGADLRKTEWKNLKKQKEADGLVVINYEMGKTIEGCKASLMATVNERGRPIFLDQTLPKGDKVLDLVEPSAFWEDSRTGLMLKVRPDYVRLTKTGYNIIEIKTTSKDNLEDVAGSIIDYAYHMQMVMQCKGLQAVTGKLPDNYYYVFVETSAPYGTYVLHVKPGSKKSKIYNLGEKLLNKAIDRAVRYEQDKVPLVYPKTVTNLDSVISNYKLFKAQNYLKANLHPHELGIEEA